MRDILVDEMTLRSGTRLSLTQRIYLVVLCSALPAVVLLFLLGYTWTRSEARHAENEALSLAGSLSRRRSDLICSAHSLLSALAVTSEVRSLNAEAGSQLVAEAIADRPQYVSVGFVNGEGVMVGSSSPGYLDQPPVDLSDRLHVREALSSERFTVGELIYGRSADGIGLALAYPIRADRGGVVIGAMVAMVSLQGLESGIDGVETPPQDTLVVSVDRFGVVLSAHRFDGTRYYPDNRTFGVGSSAHRRLHAALTGSSGKFSYAGHIAAFAASDVAALNSPFAYTLVLVPEQSALQQAQRAFSWTLASQLAAILLLLLVAHLVTRRAVGRSVAAFSNSLQRIHGGDLSVRADAQGTLTEFAPLATAFNSMASRLQQHEEQRDRSERELLHAVEEKNALLRELYHRTKNNMQVIISLMNLQSTTTDDERMRTAFADLGNRIFSMAMAHEKLCESESLSCIDAGSYIRELADHLAQNSNAGGGARPGYVRTEVHAGALSLPLEAAVPLGIILNELITNSVRHAFPNGRGGTIRIELAVTSDDTRGDQLVLRYRDDGVGISAGRQTGQRGLGSLIVTSVVEFQLAGRMTYKPGDGFEVEIAFPRPQLQQTQLSPGRPPDGLPEQG